MVQQFEDVRITGLNVAETYPSGQGALKNIALELSYNAPADWSSMFNALWVDHFYMQKRGATAGGARLMVTCMEEDLEGGLLAELKKVVAQANATYRKSVDDANAHVLQQQAQAVADSQKLAQLANKLDFS